MVESSFPAYRPLAGIRVLLVEDHADTVDLMSRLLRRAGCVVVTAETVRAAAAALAERSGIDVMICDLRLPDGSGLDVMRQLRDAGRSIRAIVLTGSDSADDERLCQDAGFEVHLTKPVNFRALEAALLLLVESPAAAPRHGLV